MNDDKFIKSIKYLAKRISNGEIQTKVLSTCGYKASEKIGGFWAWKELYTEEDWCVDMSAIELVRETLWQAHLKVYAGNEIDCRKKHKEKEA